MKFIQDDLDEIAITDLNPFFNCNELLHNPDAPVTIHVMWEVDDDDLDEDARDQLIEKIHDSIYDHSNLGMYSTKFMVDLLAADYIDVNGYGGKPIMSAEMKPVTEKLMAALKAEYDKLAAIAYED